MKTSKTRTQFFNRLALAAASSAAIAFSGGLLAAGCAPRSGCKPRMAAGACGPAAKGSCGPAARGGCGPMVSPAQVTRPEGASLYDDEPQADLVALGERLFSETSLSSNGLSCNSCHADHAAYDDTFAQPYPHYVKMADDQAGIQEIHLDEIVQFCLVSPMAGDPLPWESRELAALVAYTRLEQETFAPGHNRSGGCAPKGACAPKGGCAPRASCAPKGGCAPKAECAPKASPRAPH